MNAPGEWSRLHEEEKVKCLQMSVKIKRLR